MPSLARLAFSPVKSCHLRSARSTKSGSISTPKQTLPQDWAAISVVPLAEEWFVDRLAGTGVVQNRPAHDWADTALRRYRGFGENSVLQHALRTTRQRGRHSPGEKTHQNGGTFEVIQPKRLILASCDGGGSGIRTHGTVSRTHAFQACALSHSAISPFEALS